MMRFINFISTPSIHNHTHVKRWFIFSCSSLITVLVALSTISTQQIVAWRSLKQKAESQNHLTQKAHELIAQHAQLSKEKEMLLKKTEDWEKYTHYAKKPSNLLKVMQQNTHKGQKVKNIRLVQRSMQCTINVQKVEDSITIAQNLSSTTLFKQITVSSFKPDTDHSINATLDGKLSKE